MDYAQHVGYTGKKSVGLKLHTQAEEPAPRPWGGSHDRSFLSCQTTQGMHVHNTGSQSP